MHDRKNDNDTVREAERAAAPSKDERSPPHAVDDGSAVTPRAVAKREANERRSEERQAESGHLGAGIGDDRPPRATRDDESGE